MLLNWIETLFSRFITTSIVNEVKRKWNMNFNVKIKWFKLLGHSCKFKLHTLIITGCVIAEYRNTSINTDAKCTSWCEIGCFVIAVFMATSVSTKKLPGWGAKEINLREVRLGQNLVLFSGSVRKGLDLMDQFPGKYLWRAILPSVCSSFIPSPKDCARGGARGTRASPPSPHTHTHTARHFLWKKIK